MFRNIVSSRSATITDSWDDAEFLQIGDDGMHCEAWAGPASRGPTHPQPHTMDAESNFRDPIA